MVHPIWRQTKQAAAELLMKSQLFPQFGLPDADCQITHERDLDGIPRLMFRSRGNPLVGLDLAGASQLRQMLVQAGNINDAHEIDRHIAAARRLPLGYPQHSCL
jgi:hypothetical protein